MKLGPILVVLGIAGCDAGALPPQAPSPVAPTTVSPDKVPAATPHPHEVLATLERTACFGTCPIYTVTVYRDGVVEYDGDDFVTTKGKATGTITLAQVDAIEKLFVDNHYMSLRDSYEHGDVTDNPNANTSYHSLDGHVKHVAHYRGDHHAPSVLATIETGIDKLVGIETWIGARPKR